MSPLLSPVLPLAAAPLEGLGNDFEDQICCAVIQIMNAAPCAWHYDVDQFPAPAVCEAAARLELIRGQKLDQQPVPRAIPISSSKAIALQDPEHATKRVFYDQWRATMEGKAGKPVTIELHSRCWTFFLNEHVSTCRRIAQDAEIRAEQIWAHEKNMNWIPGPLEYLRGRPWENDPIRRRPSAAQRAEESRQREEAEFINRFRRSSS